jgi:putative FmdB family regulatory protein
MPIYEYGCGECGAEFEKLVGGPRVAVVCPSCQSARINRRLSLVGVKTGNRFGDNAAPVAGGGCCGGGCGCH